MSDHPGSERLEPHEIEELRRRLAERGTESEAVKVGDIAEALGASPEQVTAHLDHLRAEQAFSEGPVPKSRVWLSACAIAAIGISAFVVFQSLRGETEPAPTPRQSVGAPMIDGIPTPGSTPLKTAPVVTRQDPVSKPVKEMWFTFGNEMPPPHIRVQVTGMSSRFIGDNVLVQRREALEPSYETKVALLVRSIYALADDAQVVDKKLAKPKKGTKYRDFDGNVFEPHPGHFHYNIVGRCNPQSGELPFFSSPPTQTEIERIRAIAKRALAPTQAAPGDTALLPQGFSAVVSARTKIEIASTPGQLGKTTRQEVANNIASAIKAALNRDKSSGSAVPMPALSHVVIRGPLGEVVFDLPTAISRELPTQEAVEKAAQETLAKQCAMAALQINP